MLEQDGPISGLTRCLLIGTFLEGFFCDRHFTLIISFPRDSHLMKRDLGLDGGGIRSPVQT